MCGRFRSNCGHKLEYYGFLDVVFLGMLDLILLQLDDGVFVEHLLLVDNALLECCQLGLLRHVSI